MMLVSIFAAILLSQTPREEPVTLKIDCPGEVKLPMLETPRQSPIVNLEIGGKNYRFAVDTGATGGLISPKIVEELKLEPIGTVRVGDPSGQNSRERNIYRIPEVKVGGATLHGVRMSADEIRMPPGVKPEFDGVIGYAAFKGLLLTFDYPGKQVVLQPRGMNEEELHASIPYELERGIPSLTVKVGEVEMKAHVDTGADGGLALPERVKGKLNLDGEPRKIGTARTQFNAFDIFLAKVKDPIYIGGQKMPIDLVEIQGMFPNANIGGRLLRLFVVTLDQEKLRMILRAPSRV